MKHTNICNRHQDNGNFQTKKKDILNETCKNTQGRVDSEEKEKQTKAVSRKIARIKPYQQTRLVKMLNVERYLKE
jgi:hypothetical protein